MQKIKAIIFDLGGVLLNIDFDKLSSAFKKLGVKNFDEMYSKANANPLFKDLEKGKIPEEEFYEKIKDYTETSITNEQIENAWNALLLDFRKKSLQELIHLKSKYPIFLLSNTNSIHLRAVNKIYDTSIGNGSLQKYFNKVYYSHLIRARKPDAEAYEYVLKENNLPASETLFVDDSIQNIEGAKALGMQAILIKKGMKIEELNL